MSIDVLDPEESFSPDDWFMTPAVDERDYAAALRALDDDLDLDTTAGDLPVWDTDPGSDEGLVTSLRMREVHAADLLALASVDVEGLASDLYRVEALTALRRVEALAASMRYAALVALAGPESSGDSLAEDAGIMEIALGCGMSQYAVAKDLQVARALASTFRSFGAALAAGDVSERHCVVLVERTVRVVDREVLAVIERKALRKAVRQHPGEFRATVDKLVAELDPDAAGRVRRARATRDVFIRPEGDGMAFLGVRNTAPAIEAMFALITAHGQALQAERGGAAAVREGDEDAAAGACRADALTAITLGQTAADGSVTFDPAEQVKVVVNVVMDLDTLRGEADRPALVEGTPVPAQIAREVAAGAAWWRRLVTAPVTGHLLDYGRAAYCPEPLRRFVLARDDTCRRPGCTRRAEQMDHANPFPHGPTDTVNCHGLCVRCHQLKTAGYADITDTDADGSLTWLTAYGQRIHVPPRPVLGLGDPGDAPPLEGRPPEGRPRDGGPPRAEPLEEPPF